MKKTILFGIIFLSIGIIFGTKIYAVTSLEDSLKEGETYYFIQEGIYTSKVILEENTQDIPIKSIDKENDKYYVYLGITKNESIAKKIKQLYVEKGYSIYIKEQTIDNIEFSGSVTQFDLLLNSTEETDEILKITEVVLANYEEIIKNQ